MSIYAHERRARQEESFQAHLLRVRLEQEQIENSKRKGPDVAHMRTPWGLAKKPPQVEEIAKSIDQLHELVGEAIDAVKIAAEHEAALSAGAEVDAARFPSVGGSR